MIVVKYYCNLIRQKWKCSKLLNVKLLIGNENNCILTTVLKWVTTLVEDTNVLLISNICNQIAQDAIECLFY